MTGGSAAWHAAPEILPVTDLRDLLPLLPGAQLASVLPRGPVPLAGVTGDSRKVAAGYLFCCVPGATADGHDYLPEAVTRGATAALVERPVPGCALPQLVVPAVRRAMPLAAAAVYGYPSRAVRLVGVTGTNGKTTTTFLVEAIARAARRSTGVIGTIGARINQALLPGDRTTPEGPDLQALLARMVAEANGREMVVAMEASSHALAQGRTLGCEFEVGVFTNLTQDHLDYHRDMEDYFLAKALLFTEYPRRSGRPFTAVVNTGDPYGRRLAELAEGRVVTCAVRGEGGSSEGTSAELEAHGVQATPSGLEFLLTAPEGEYRVRTGYGGLFNVANTLGAIGAARALGIGWETILEALAAARGVPGRFESVDEGQPFSVIVDYAHTPDGVANVLRAARALRPRRLWAVFGCGGDRDRTKRPQMGRLAAELADGVIVTSDNPRSEDPARIIDDILEGIPPAAIRQVEIEPDRAAAIRKAVALAEPGDLIVIAGKGHEDYQIFAERTVHFDDREEARKAIHARLSA